MSAIPPAVVLETASAPLARNPAELAAAKVAAGTETPMVVIPVVPATGPIAQPTGATIGLVLLSFWKSPTVRWVIGILTGVLVSVLLKVQPLLATPDVDWSLVWSTFKMEFVAALVAAVMLRQRVHDNNPVNGPTAPAAKP